MCLSVAHYLWYALQSLAVPSVHDTRRYVYCVVILLCVILVNTQTHT